MHSRHYLFKPTFLNQGWVFVPGDIWQCLETLLGVITGGHGWWSAYWHLVLHGTSPPQRIIWPQMSVVLRFEAHWLEYLKKKKQDSSQTSAKEVLATEVLASSLNRANLPSSLLSVCVSLVQHLNSFHLISAKYTKSLFQWTRICSA